MKNQGHVGMFFLGFFSGLIFLVVILLGMGYYALKNPQKLAEKASEYGLVKVVEKTVIQQVTKTMQSLPHDYMAVRQNEINHSVQKVTRAYTTNQLSQSELQQLSGQLMSSISDQKLEPEEIDRLLKLVEEIGK